MGNLRYTNRPSDTSDKDDLAHLALDVSYSGNHVADSLWRQLNPDLWERTHNAWVVLQTVSGETLEKITSQPDFRATLTGLIRARKEERDAPHWFEQTHKNSALQRVAYFSMEYMLSEALPIYSGGLGNVAGDQLKSADDLGVPVVGIGLLYSQGYFRQELDRDGGQRALYPYNDPGQLPIRPLRDAHGDWLRLSLPFPGCELWVRAWVARVGRTRLYLLDTNDPANFPEFRGITSELYGGGPDLRLRQEIVLGIGGWRLLRTLGIKPEVCHLNEGHAAFAVLERAASFMDDTGQGFWTALAATRAGNLFTTHTAVEAGFDRFSADLLRPYFTPYCANRLKISFDEFLSLGRANPFDHGEPFNMAYFATHGSGRVNAVSRLHSAVSRNLFRGMFPRWPSEEVPVGYVTNGVHMPTWDSPDATELWAGACGPKCWHGNLEQVDVKIRDTPDAAVWSMRSKGRKALIEYIRTRYARQIAMQGAPADQVAAVAGLFNFDTLTLGFARRFATYKRPTLLLHDPERLLRLLHNAERPVQLVIAGKAHPQDGPGQDLLRQWNRFIQRAGVQSPVVFLSDYDMRMAEHLAGGVDVWINTPRRPWEACGTSGMKVLVNGGLNVSELDGWWVEAYTPEVGWALGDGQEHGDDPGWDAAEAEVLYGLLEREIVPQYYERNQAGIPVQWVARIKESMARLTPQYSANRAVREYTESHYIPAAAAYTARADQNAAAAAELLAWQQKISAEWHGLSFGPLKVEAKDGQLHFEIPLRFGALPPDSVRVELFANSPAGGAPIVVPMQMIPMQGPAQLQAGEFLYVAAVADNRKAGEFTPRVVPYHPAASVPLEANQILWQQ